MNYVFEPAPPPALPVAGSDRLFAVRRVYCVGRNYAEHAREMGADPKAEPPFFFSKPADALVSGGEMHYPAKTANYQHEVELVVALGCGGASVPAQRALDLVFGYAVGLDMTRRDLQTRLKAKGWPWEMGKGADQSAPVGPIHPVEAVGHPARGAIRLSVNGVQRQCGDLSDMIWKVGEVIAQLSEYVELRPGDLVFTGTPAGVAAVERGDAIEAAIEGLGELRLRVV